MMIRFIHSFTFALPKNVEDRFIVTDCHTRQERRDGSGSIWSRPVICRFTVSTSSSSYKYNSSWNDLQTIRVFSVFDRNVTVGGWRCCVVLCWRVAKHKEQATLVAKRGLQSRPTTVSCRIVLCSTNNIGSRCVVSIRTIDVRPRCTMLCCCTMLCSRAITRHDMTWYDMIWHDMIAVVSENIQMLARMQ